MVQRCEVAYPMSHKAEPRICRHFYDKVQGLQIHTNTCAFVPASLSPYNEF